MWDDQAYLCVWGPHIGPQVQVSEVMCASRLRYFLNLIILNPCKPKQYIAQVIFFSIIQFFLITGKRSVLSVCLFEKHLRQAEFLRSKGGQRFTDLQSTAFQTCCTISEKISFTLKLQRLWICLHLQYIISKIESLEISLHEGQGQILEHHEMKNMTKKDLKMLSS